MTDDPHDETPEEAVENYNAWIDLALQKAENEQWGDLREMIEETPFRSSYLYCLVRVHWELLQRHEEQERQYRNKLLVQGQHLARERRKVRDLLKGLDLPTTDDE